MSTRNNYQPYRGNSAPGRAMGLGDMSGAPIRCPTGAAAMPISGRRTPEDAAQTALCAGESRRRDSRRDGLCGSGSRRDEADPLNALIARGSPALAYGRRARSLDDNTREPMYSGAESTARPGHREAVTAKQAERPAPTIQGPRSRAYSLPTGLSASLLPSPHLTRVRRVRSRRASLLFDRVVVGGALTFAAFTLAALVGAACWGGC